MKCAVVGIPKTVDNDLMFIDRSFGFETAVQRAKESIAAVHMEAASQIGGIDNGVSFFLANAVKVGYVVDVFSTRQILVKSVMVGHEGGIHLSRHR